MGLYTHEGEKFRTILLKPYSSGSYGMMNSSTFSPNCEDCGVLFSSLVCGDGETTWSVPLGMSFSFGMLGVSMMHEGEQSFKNVEASKDIWRCECGA